MEWPQMCVSSVIEIRKFLTTEISQPHESCKLESSLRAMRSACHKFLDNVDARSAQKAYLLPSSENWMLDFLPRAVFDSNLGELRGVFGVHIAIICAQYGLDLEPGLSTIVRTSDDSEG
jgi:hypothetical protein